MLSTAAQQPPPTPLPTLPTVSNGDVSWKKRCIFVSGCSGVAAFPHGTGRPMSCSPPGPTQACRAAAGARRTRRTSLPQHITYFYSDSWCVIATLEGEETAFISKEQLVKSICVKPGIFHSVQPGTVDVAHCRLVLGKRPAQKSTDWFLQALTRLSELPHGPAPRHGMQRCSGRIRPARKAAVLAAAPPQD